MRFTFSRAWALGLFVLGVLFEMASIFLPWGIITSTSFCVYLPESIVLGEIVPPSVEDLLILLDGRAQLLAISRLIKAAITVGLVGVVLYCFVEKYASSHVLGRVLCYGVLLASSTLSFVAAAMLMYTKISYSLGAYLALAGGGLLLFGLVLKELKVEVVVEREISEQGR